MKARSKLTLAYLQHDPAAAARVLQDLEPAVASAFLDTVPARIAAPVINSMVPFAAARCLSRLLPHRSAAVLRQLLPHDRTSLVRIVPREQRAPILEELPEKMKQRIANALRYPVSCVGAWVDPQVPVLRADNRVGDALKFLGDSSAVSHVFIESSDEEVYAGAISLVALLGSHAEARLAEIATVQVVALSNRATLASVQAHPAWDDFLMLPVTGRRGTVLGGLSRRALREGLHQRHERLAHRKRPIVAELSGALLASSTGLVKLVLPAHDWARGQNGQGDYRAD